MLVSELLPLVKDVSRVVDVAPGRANLRRHLGVPDEVPYSAADLADITDAAFTSDTLLLCLVGPQDATHTPAGDLGATLRALPVGAKVLMLVGWPPQAFPYDLVLGPLVDGRCQVTDAVQVESSGSNGPHIALLAERVDELVAPRPQLTDVSDALSAQLWTTNQHLLGELVDGAMRQRVSELEERAAELETELATRTKDVARAKRRAKTLESSASFRLGRALVDGAKHPGKAVVTVPRDLLKI